MCVLLLSCHQHSIAPLYVCKQVQKCKLPHTLIWSNGLLDKNNYLQPQVITTTCIASLATLDNNLTGSHAIRHHLRQVRQLNPCNITER